MSERRFDSKISAPDYVCATPSAIRRLRPLYWMLTLVLAVIYVWALVRAPDLRTPARLLPFTGLMAAHVGLHWIGPYLTTRRRWLALYLIVQAVLVFALSLLARSQTATLGLYLVLAGQAVGVLEDVRFSSIAVVGYLAFSALNCALLWGWESLSTWLAWIAPMAFFIAVYVVTFIRQARACQHVQALLSELEGAHRQLAEYAVQVERLTLTAERQRMARELHDTLTQGLAGLVLQLEALETHLGRGDGQKAALIASQAKDRARAALADARQAIHDLRAQPALSGALAEAIRAEVQHFSSATGIPCTLDLDPALALSDSGAEHALRCVSEGLANVARHARAAHVGVTLAARDGSALVEVHDDGVGFDPRAVAEQAGHYGLVGLRERARLAGGTLEIESAPGAGTTLRLRLPLEAGEDE